MHSQDTTEHDSNEPGGLRKALRVLGPSSLAISVLLIVSATYMMLTGDPLATDHFGIAVRMFVGLPLILFGLITTTLSYR